MRSLFEGLRVIDASTMVAGAFSASLFGDFGADVIKIERPRIGDPVRQLLPHKDGVPLWWKVLSRNKRSVAIDLASDDGRAVLLKLMPSADVLIESFRPGTLERWRLGPDELSAARPGLVMLRISGFGQTGPQRRRPGFGRFAEAFSGLAAITGHADGPPLHAGLPVADYVTGTMGWGAASAALLDRERAGAQGCQVIDLALYESLFRLMEFAVAEHDQLGVGRQRMGNVNPYVAPVNTYRLSDGSWITFTGSTQSIVTRLFGAIGRPELAQDPRFHTNVARIAHREELDAIISAWFAERSLEEVERRFDEFELPFAPILDAAGMLEDPQYAARENIVRVADAELGSLRMQGVVPKFSLTPGQVRWAGPRLGEHTDEVLIDELGIPRDAVASMRRSGAIS